MGHTQHSRTAGVRRGLRREVAGTIGLLADEQDFEAMRLYRSFTFDDHTTYLRQVEGLLKSQAAAGGYTTVTLFDPAEFTEFCRAEGLDPDSAISRTRFTAELAASGPGVAYQGQPMADLVPELVEEAVRQATWEFATSVLSRTGACAVCGQDVGRMAFARASYLVSRVIDALGEGAHHWVCSVLTDRSPCMPSCTWTPRNPTQSRWMSPRPWRSRPYWRWRSSAGAPARSSCAARSLARRTASAAGT